MADTKHSSTHPIMVGHPAGIRSHTGTSGDLTFLDGRGVRSHGQHGEDRHDSEVLHLEGELMLLESTLLLQVC